MKIVLILCMLLTAYADINPHMMRGSNNRLNEARRAVQTDTRLFDSQNNARAGYNAGPGYQYFYVGSILSLQWTNQHMCQGANSNCDLIFQYMCSDKIRDGLTTHRIPDLNKHCANNDCNNDRKYGMHEDYEYYMNCKYRQRNQELFTADQDLGLSARSTRQNPDENNRNNRHGYECPEERDYYPYWGPSPWKDIAILTDDTTKCKDYEKESQNVKDRYYCDPPEKYKEDMKKRDSPRNFPKIPITKKECEQFRYPANNLSTGGVWKSVAAWGIDPPKCLQSPKSRDNHNGNGEDGEVNHYEWEIPNDPNKNCIWRIRYNISTNDYNTKEVDYEQNGDPAYGIDIGKLVGLSTEDAKKRGYVFKNDPEVQPLGGTHGNKIKLAIALNTAQFGRTFEDRSHAFRIEERPDELKDEKIYNVGVIGKRGNIVEVYPAVEYDFWPNDLTVKEGDFVHFQWTGSNDNDRGNDGEGPAGEDRSNLILCSDPRFESKAEDHEEYGDLKTSYPNYIKNISFLGFSKEDILKLAYAIPDGMSLEDIRDGPPRSPTPYFDLPPRKVKKTGIYNYLCTINNNFTNRSQKARIVVKEDDAKKKKDSQTTNRNGEKESERKYHADEKKK